MIGRYRPLFIIGEREESRTRTDGTHQIHWPAAEIGRQPFPQGESHRNAPRVCDQEPPQDVTGVGVDVDLEIGDRT